MISKIRDLKKTLTLADLPDVEIRDVNALPPMIRIKEKVNELICKYIRHYSFLPPVQGLDISLLAREVQPVGRIRSALLGIYIQPRIGELMFFRFSDIPHAETYLLVLVLSLLTNNSYGRDVCQLIYKVIMTRLGEGDENLCPLRLD